MFSPITSSVLKAVRPSTRLFLTNSAKRSPAPLNTTLPRRLSTMASKYPQRKIGDDSVSAEGLGCMGMSFSYTSFGGFDNEQSYQVLTKAADMGITLWDTSDVSKVRSQTAGVFSLMLVDLRSTVLIRTSS